MSTRIYLPLAGLVAISPPVDAGWEASAGLFARYPTSTVKSDTALADRSEILSLGAPGQVCWWQGISPPLDVDQSISGTFDLVVRGTQGSIDENARLAAGIRVIKPDLTTRGTLRAVTASGDNELSVTGSTRIISGAALTTVAALAGDRIVPELGISTSPASANVDPVLLRFGDPAAVADFALTSNLVTDLCSWLELSGDLTFAPEVALGGTALDGMHEPDPVAGGRVLTITPRGGATWVSA